MTIPIRNRAAQADQVRSELEYRQAQMILQQQENEVRIDVRQTQFALMQNRARVEAARRSVDFSRENLDAEQKKYDLGASTNTLVLQAQRDLAQSESVTDWCSDGVRKGARGPRSRGWADDCQNEH